MKGNQFFALGAILLGAVSLHAYSLRKRRKQAEQDAIAKALSAAEQADQLQKALPDTPPEPVESTEAPGSMQLFCKQRNITSLLHFTRCTALESIMRNGLLSHDDVRSLGLPVVDELRLDQRSDQICLSISFPNSRMFYKYAASDQTQWCVLELRENLVDAFECMFLPTNAACSGSRLLRRSELIGPKAFEQMFAQYVNGEMRSGMLPSCHPTDVQAEVMCASPIEHQWIRAVHFLSNGARDRHQKLLAEHGIQACVSPQLFLQRDLAIMKGCGLASLQRR